MEGQWGSKVLIAGQEVHGIWKQKSHGMYTYTHPPTDGGEEEKKGKRRGGR